jgi:hypothetical protein
MLRRELLFQSNDFTPTGENLENLLGWKPAI